MQKPLQRSYSLSQSPQNLSPNLKRAISPYGVSFGDEVKYKKMMQRKYKEDLDYLCSLKKSREMHRALELNEDNRYQFMNDKYNYDRMSQIALMREYDDYNEREARIKRQEREQEKKQSLDEYMQNMNQYKNQSELQKQVEKDKKEKLRQECQNDLMNFYRRKDKEKLDKLNERNINKELFQQENERFNYSSDLYRSKINSMNNRIYNNVRKYNDFVYGGANNDLYRNANDFEYNRRLAEMRSKERRDQLYNTERYRTMREQEQKEKLEYNKMMQKQKMDNQRNYKEFLDVQNEQKRLEKESFKKSTLTESAEQLIMPSYKYPNLPQPLVKKAFDPINIYSRTPNGSNEINQIERSSYLGDSQLKHNPITCPINDIDYNKYVSSAINKISI